MKRDSRFEVLRIISMFLIILFHMEYFSQSWRFAIKHNWHIYPVEAAYLSLGKLGVYLFVMITGYFVGGKTYSISKSGKKAILIWLETIFYSLLIFVFGLITGIVKKPNQQVWLSVFPFISDLYWFVDGYIILILLIPFINRALRESTRKEFIYLIGIFSILSSALAGYSPILNNEIQASFLFPAYLIGAYLRKYDINISYAGTKCVLIYAITISGAVVFYLIKWDAYVNIFYFGIFQLIMATLMFDRFANIKPFYSKTINLLAKSVFAMYLITDNNIIRDFLWELPIFKNATISLWKINLIGIPIVIGLMIACALIDRVRVALVRALRRLWFRYRLIK